MKIQNINSTYNRTQYQTVKKSNNSQPSFQHRKIYEEKFWDKDILHAIKHNKEIQKLEVKSSRFPLAGVWWNGKRRLYIQFTYYI